MIHAVASYHHIGLIGLLHCRSAYRIVCLWPRDLWSISVRDVETQWLHWLHRSCLRDPAWIEWQRQFDDRENIFGGYYSYYTKLNNYSIAYCTQLGSINTRIAQGDSPDVSRLNYGWRFPASWSWRRVWEIVMMCDAWVLFVAFALQLAGGLWWAQVQDRAMRRTSFEGRPLLPVKEFRSTVKTNMSRKGNCSPRKAGDRTAKDMCQPRLTYNVHNTWHILFPEQKHGFSRKGCERPAVGPRKSALPGRAFAHPWPWNKPWNLCFKYELTKGN